MTYTQEQYTELESRCNSWRQLCYKHEQTICDLKYQIVCLEASQDPHVNNGHVKDEIED